MRALVLLFCLLSVSAETFDFKGMLTWEEHKTAKVYELSNVSKSHRQAYQDIFGNKNAIHNIEFSLQELKTKESQLRALIESLGLDSKGEFTWRVDSVYLSFRYYDGDEYSCSGQFYGFDSLEQLSFTSLLNTDMRKALKAKDEVFFSQLYQQIFGEKVLGKFDAERSQWRSHIDGIESSKSAIAYVEYDSKKGYFDFFRGISSAEFARNKVTLRESPVRITERQAIVLAWQNWLSLTKSEEAKANDFTIRLEKSFVGDHSHNPRKLLIYRPHEEKSFMNETAKKPEYYFKVTFDKIHFWAAAYINPHTGEVFFLEEGKRGW